MNKECYVYNMDETGKPFRPQKAKMFYSKGYQKVHRQSSGNKSQSTILACSNAVLLHYCLWWFSRVSVWTKNEPREKYPESADKEGIQSHEISTKVCAVCFVLYQDDLSSTRKLLTEWMQCTNTGCMKWMHIQCVHLSEELYSCEVCGTQFN